ncbi:hypothetical protein PENTCL1PPCAC_15255, partial [Pristionchus entomophagus]
VATLILFSFVIGISYHAYVHSTIMKSLFHSTLEDRLVNISNPLVVSPRLAEIHKLISKPIAALFAQDFEKQTTAILDIDNLRCFIKHFSHFPAVVR